MTLFNEQAAELLALRASVKSLGEKLEASQARIELLEHDAKTGDYETLYAQAVCELQASRAREAQLREALKVPHHGMELLDVFKVLDNALALPTDDPALKARLKAERERCAKVCDVLAEEGFTTYAAAREIRNLGDE